jgi:hypothetical protein
MLVRGREELAISARGLGSRLDAGNGLGTVFAAHAAVRPAARIVGELLDLEAFTPPSRCLLEAAGALVFACFCSLQRLRYVLLQPLSNPVLHHIHISRGLTGYHPPIVLQPHPPSTKPSCRVVLELLVRTSGLPLVRRLLRRGRLAHSRLHTASSRKAEEGRNLSTAAAPVCCALLGPHTSTSYTQYG